MAAVDDTPIVVPTTPLIGRLRPHNWVRRIPPTMQPPTAAKRAPPSSPVSEGVPWRGKTYGVPATPARHTPHQGIASVPPYAEQGDTLPGGRTVPPPRAPASSRQPPFSSSAPRIPTQTDFRRRYLKATIRERLIRVADGSHFKLHSMVMDGDCGFAAVAKGMNLLSAGRAAGTVLRSTSDPSDSSGTATIGATAARCRRTPSPARRRRRRTPPHTAAKPGVTARALRERVAAEVQANLDEYEALSRGVFSVDDLRAFTRDVLRGGMTGHWLGAALGALEFVAVARALGVTVAVYCFDVRSQTVRRFEEARADTLAERGAVGEKPGEGAMEAAGGKDRGSTIDAGEETALSASVSSFRVGALEGEPTARSELCLLFTGPAAGGHFDLLWPAAPAVQTTPVAYLPGASWVTGGYGGGARRGLSLDSYSFLGGGGWRRLRYSDAASVVGGTAGVEQKDGHAATCAFDELDAENAMERSMVAVPETASMVVPGRPLFPSGVPR